MGLQNGTPSLPAPEQACLSPNKDGSFQTTVIPKSCHPRLQQSLEAAEVSVQLARTGGTLKETNSPKACTNVPRTRIVNSHISQETEAQGSEDPLPQRTVLVQSQNSNFKVVFN